MIEKDKTYTGEEVKKLFMEAQKEAVKKEMADLKKAEDKAEGELDPMMTLMFSMQNMSAYASLYHILFKDEKEDE